MHFDLASNTENIGFLKMPSTPHGFCSVSINLQIARIFKFDLYVLSNLTEKELFTERRRSKSSYSVIFLYSKFYSNLFHEICVSDVYLNIKYSVM